MSGITKDYTAAFEKTRAILAFPKAAKRNATEWGAETVKLLKISARGLKKSHLYLKSVKIGAGKTGTLMRSIGMNIEPSGETFKLTLGTGVGTTEKVRMAEKYAMIQDKGGTTHPTVTKRMRRWAWWMFYHTADDKYKGIALTAKSKLTVKIPRSNWFTNIWKERIPILDKQYLSEEAILKTAERMKGKENAG